jgi:hypothetical protein
VAIEITACVRMFSWSLAIERQRLAHKDDVAVSYEDDIFSTHASLMNHASSSRAQKFKIRSNRLLNEQKVPHVQALESALRHGLNRAGGFFRNSIDQTIESAKTPIWPNACIEGSAK